MKTSFSIFSIVLVLCLFLPTDIYNSMCLSRTSNFVTRITYILLHGNVFHLVMNVYCMLSIIFLSFPKKTDVFMSFLIAFFIPDYFIGESNIVGISVMLFAFTGILVMRSTEWKRFFLFNLAVVVCGALIPKIAFMPHLWGFSCGCLYGIITAKRYGSI